MSGEKERKNEREGRGGNEIRHRSLDKRKKLFGKFVSKKISLKITDESARPYRLWDVRTFRLKSINSDPFGPGKYFVSFFFIVFLFFFIETSAKRSTSLSERVTNQVGDSFRSDIFFFNKI